MARTTCPNCQCEIEDTDVRCPHCKTYINKSVKLPEDENIESEKDVRERSAEKGAFTVPFGILLLVIGFMITMSAKDKTTAIVGIVSMITGIGLMIIFFISHHSEISSIKEEAEQAKREAARRSAQEPVKCPYCGSTQIQAVKKGFSGGKAVVGGLIAGPIGLAAGAIGSGDIERVCLNCGKKF